MFPYNKDKNKTRKEGVEGRTHKRWCKEKFKICARVHGAQEGMNERNERNERNEMKGMTGMNVLFLQHFKSL